MAQQSNSTGKFIENDYYLNADDFFRRLAGEALTYDDVSLATNYSDILPRETKLETTLSESLRLQLPIISSDMDTVTEAEMAIGMALNGGLGLIHYNMTERQQVKQVARVKNHVHGLIQEPITVKPDQSIGDILAMIAERGYKFSTFPVIGEDGTLAGLLSGHVVRERYAAKLVSEAMTPRAEVLTLNDSTLGDNPIKTADQFFNEHMGIHKLLVVDKNDRVKGLFTLSDIERITEETGSHHRAAPYRARRAGVCT